MSITNPWLLPEGIDEVLPPEAGRLDSLCRELVDLYRSWGYELVMPPMIEYLDSLLTGTKEDLNLQTFKIVDQLNGKSMGVRADTTPQVARIDAHNLKKQGPQRFCYLGTVLHTRPSTHGGTRAPLQTGAELYGHDGNESDAEILSLMLKTMNQVQINNTHVDLGHVGIYRGLLEEIDINTDQQDILFDALQRKDVTELKQLIDDANMKASIADKFLSLVELNGDLSVLQEARSLLKNSGDLVSRSLDQLESIAELTHRQVKQPPLYIDLAELRGYHYYTGMTFAAYVPGQGQGIAFGGRYDDIGAAYGRSRPATGFSTDMKMLFELSQRTYSDGTAIFAPVSELPGLIDAINKSRAEGETVICELPGQSNTASEMGCNRELFLEQGVWKVRQI